MTMIERHLDGPLFLPFESAVPDALPPPPWHSGLGGEIGREDADSEVRNGTVR